MKTASRPLGSSLISYYFNSFQTQIGTPAPLCANIRAGAS